MTNITAFIQRIKAAADEGNFPIVSPNDCRLVVDTLDKAKQSVETLESRNCRLEGIITAAEQRIADLVRSNAAQDSHINQQQDRIDILEKRNAELGKYAGELESRTVKLAADRAAESGISGYDGTEFYRAGWNARGKADKEALTAAGIKVEAE